MADVVRARWGGPPSGGEVALWHVCALHRALPTPGPWAEAYQAAGIDVSIEQVEARFVALIEDQLGTS